MQLLLAWPFWSYLGIFVILFEFLQILLWNKIHIPTALNYNINNHKWILCSSDISSKDKDWFFLHGITKLHHCSYKHRFSAIGIVKYHSIPLSILITSALFYLIKSSRKLCLSNLETLHRECWWWAQLYGEINDFNNLTIPNLSWRKLLEQGFLMVKMKSIIHRLNGRIRYCTMHYSV